MQIRRLLAWPPLPRCCCRVPPCRRRREDDGAAAAAAPGPVLVEVVAGDWRRRGEGA